MSYKTIIFSGNSNPGLAAEVSNYLNTPLGNALVSRFKDGESRIEILENVRGADVFILQSTSAPTNTNLMELLLMADAIRRASALRITAVIPYYGYARQDKRILSKRVPISAKVVSDLLATVGIDRVITMDLHAEQIQGFFTMPVDNIYASKMFIEDALKKEYENPMVISPDVGGVVRATSFAKRLNHAPLAIIDKRRPSPNEAIVMNIVGKVKDRTCIIVDDLVDTGGTICQAAEALKENKAKKVVAYCTHPVLSGSAVDKINQSVLDELVVSNTIPLNEKARSCSKIRQISISEMLAEAMKVKGSGLEI
jgi:ribose-phosphate pyrophosphokinase